MGGCGVGVGWVRGVGGRGGVGRCAISLMQHYVHKTPGRILGSTVFITKGTIQIQSFHKHINAKVCVITDMFDDSKNFIYYLFTNVQI